MRKRLEALKNDQKGFTLVELIVVLVILAIMAALLVPALLGYVDKAREGKYLEEARSIYTAIQAVQDEKYAANAEPIKNLTVVADKTKVDNLVAPTVVTSVTIGNKKTTGKDKEAYIVDTLTNLVFVSQDGSTITAQLKDSIWTVDSIVTGSGTGS